MTTTRTPTLTNNHFDYPLSEGGLKVVSFAEKWLRHTKGRWRGTPVVLEPWQVSWICELFRRDDNGVRIYREALLGLPRKNGKSTLASVLALYALLVEGAMGDGGAEIYSAAASKDQARIVFGAAKEMLENSALKDYCRIYKDTIYVPSTGAIYKVLPAGYPEKLHGLNPSFVIADEVHAHKDPELYYALRTGSLARLEPMVVSITTAGFDLDTICGELYRRGQKGDDPTFLAKWLEVPEEFMKNTRAWKIANPASWIDEEDLIRESKSLPWGVFCRLHLNRWTRVEEQWLPKGAWDEIRRKAVACEPGETIWVGVDIGRKHDTAAVVWAWKTEDGKVAVKAHVWGAHPDPSKPAPTAHTIVEDDQVPLGLIENFIRELATEYDVEEVIYDPYLFQRSAELLEDEGILTLEWPQSNERMVPASQGLFDGVVEQLLLHDGDEVFSAHIASAVARDTGRGWRLDKRKTKAAMDAAIALALAYARASEEDEGRPSVTIL